MLPELSALRPEQRARAILASAQGELNARLWQAALGGQEDRGSSATAPAYISGIGGLDALLADMVKGGAGASPIIAPRPSALAPAASPNKKASGLPPVSAANAPYAASISAASARTGIPAVTLAAIVNAEAGKGRDGAWNPLSRNPRSSAAGLGQFIGGTWLGLARQAGTWLNRHARAQGLIDDTGTVLPGAQSALLALRYDPEAAIESVADYARMNVARLRHAGALIGDTASDLARAAYIGHHLGPGDAIRFYNGGLESARAARLLSAQIGAERAGRRIAAAGDAATAHRGWLMGYVEKFIG